MSGIYVKGMEMPKRDATFLVHVNGDTIDLTPPRKYAEEYHREREIYKLIPVPEHGRLGDLDILREALEKAELEAREECYKLFNVEEECEYEQSVWDGLHMAAKILSTAPTIIPANKQEVGA